MIHCYTVSFLEKVHCSYNVNIDLLIQCINFIVSTTEEYSNNTLPLAALNGEQRPTSNDDASAQQISCDEQLISCVAQKQALFDHRIPANKESNLKKKALWQEVSNIMGG